MSPRLRQSERGDNPEAAAGAPKGSCGAGRDTRSFPIRRGFAVLALLLLLTVQAPRTAASVPDGTPRVSTRVDQAVTWSNFTPTGLVTSVPLVSTITAASGVGLEPSGDAYAVSTDGGATWSPWLTAGLSADIPISTTHHITVGNLALPDSASLNFIRYRTLEAGGAESVSPAYAVRVDATAPASPQNLTASPDTWTNAGSFTISWTNPPDIAGIAGAWYKLDAPPTGSSDGTFVAASTSISGISPGTPGDDDGAHPAYVWLEDTLGRADHATATSTTLYWDTTAPEPPTRMSGSPAQKWTNVNSFSESWRNPADLSGIAGAYYKLNERPTSATDGTFVATSNTITNIQVPHDGHHDIYVWLVDGAGNIDPQAYTGDPNVFWYDGTLPVSSLVVTPTLPATGWFTSSVAISLSALDLPAEPSYPPAVDYQLDGTPWTSAPPVINVSAEGPHQLRYRARDRAGNLETAKDFNFGVDMTAPAVTLQPDRLPNPTGWYTSAVTYTLSVVDLTSGSPQGFYRLNDGAWQGGAAGGPVTFTLAAEGSYRIEYYGQDAAGNRSKTSALEAHLDATPPETGQAIDGAVGENGWHVSNVTVRLLPQDNGSGIDSTRYRINGASWQAGTEFPLTGDALYEVAYYSTDAAGNVGATVATQVKLDMVAPGGPAGLNAAPAGWSRTNSFTVQWTSPSDLSGVTAAYYKLGDLSGGGAPTGPKDGTVVSQTQRIDGLAVPAEGSYRLYLWLRDAAGNADHKTAPGMVPPSSSPVLRFDATAPVTTAEVQGQPGSAGWWLSPVSVNLTATDAASGIAAVRYRLDGGAWQTSNKATVTVPITQPDKHTVEYYAEDVAGNVEAPQLTTVRLDFAAPPSPSGVRVAPEGWTRFNGFHFEWRPQSDLSGIGGAYVRFGSPPASAGDGVFYAGSTEINGVKAPAEGKHTAYLWLRDGAGNADVRTAIAISDSVWYDGTPPVTIITPTAASGLNGWYVEPVIFDMSAADTASGLLNIHYQVDGGAVQSAAAGQFAPDTRKTASSFVVSSDGRHTVRIWAEDRAGNLEPAHAYEVAIDTTAPSVSFSGPQAPVTRTQFDVSWTGGDPREGSGLASYDVQVRDGYGAAWQDWLTNTKFTAARFSGQRGHTYFFRVFGRDVAGNRQQAPGMIKVLVQPVLNGSFDTGNFTDWTTSPMPFLSAVVPTTGPANVSTLSARLGSEEYGPSLPPTGNVPAGCVTISQTLSIPNLQQVQRPTLRFWYRVKTYDVMYSEHLKSFVDTLDVKFAQEGAPAALLLRAGNPTNNWGTLYDTGWQIADVDLEAYAGTTGVLSFANCNGPQNGRPDNLLNTWSFVDSVEIIDRASLYLPLLTLDGGEAGAAAAPTTGSETETPPPDLPTDKEPIR